MRGFVLQQGILGCDRVGQGKEKSCRDRVGYNRENFCHDRVGHDRKFYRLRQSWAYEGHVRAIDQARRTRQTRSGTHD